MSRFAVALFLVVGACSGDDDGTTEPIGPETCDNGVDDNGNGLVDCEDSTFCGGLQCVTTGDDDDDTTTELPEVEIDFSGTSVEFTFTPQAGTCSQPIRTFTVVNRNEDLEAVVDANCDLINGGTAGIGFDVDGASPRQYVVDEPLAPATSMELGMFFACRGINDAFTTVCRVKVDLEGITDQVEFDANGTPL